MPNTVQGLVQLENMEGFKDLPWEAQQEARSGVLAATLPKYEWFKKAPPPLKQKVFNSIMAMPPRFTDGETSQKVNEISALWKSGDKNKQQYAKQLMTSVLAARDWFANSTLSNFLKGTVLKPLAQQVEGGGQQYAAFLERQPTFRGQPVIKTESLLEWKPDQEKAAKYFEFLLSKDRQAARFMKNVRTGSQLLSTASDILMWEGLLAGAPMAPRGVGRLATSAFTKAEKFATSGLVKSLARTGRAASHAAVTGAVGVIREETNKWLTGKATFPYGQEELLDMFGTFKTYALWDVGINFITGVAWPMLKVMGYHNWKGFGDAAQAYKGLTVDELNNLMYKAQHGIPPDRRLLARLPKETRNVFEAKYVSGKIRANLPKVSNEDLFTHVSLQNGVSAVKKGNVWEVGLVGDDAIQTFTDFEKAQKHSFDLMKKIGRVETSEETAAIVGGLKGKAKIHEVFQGTLSEGSLKNSDVLVNLAAPVDGGFRADKLSTFTKALLKGEGASEKVLKSVKVLDRGNSLMVQVNNITMGVFPKTVNKLGKELPPIENLIRNIHDKVNLDTKRSGKYLIENYDQLVGENKLYTPAWTRYAAKNNLSDVASVTERGGKVHLVLRNGKSLGFDDYQKLGDYVLSRSVDEKTVKGYLKRYHGLELSINEKGAAVYEAHKKIAQAENLQQLLQQYPGFLPKTPSNLGPKFTFVNNNKLNIEYVRGTAVGKYQDLLKHLDQFYDTSAVTEKVTLSAGPRGKISHYKFKKNVIVEIPEISYHQRFSNIGDARKFLKGGWEEYEALEHIANTKGYRLDSWGGKFYLYTTDGEFVADNRAELYKLLREVKNPEWMPEISGLTEEFLKGMDDLPATFFKPYKYPSSMRGNPEQISSWLKLSMAWRPPHALLEKAVEQGTDPGLIKAFREVEDTLQSLRSTEGEMAKIIQTMFRRVKGGRYTGRWIPRKKRIALYEYMSEPNQARKAQIAANHRLDQDDIRAAGQIRDWLGRSSEEGAFADFQVDPDLFLTDYLPKIRKYLQVGENRAWVNSLKDGQLSKMLDGVYRGNIPKELDAFFKHQRVSSVADLALEKDPLVLLLKYNAVGHRQQILGPIWDKIGQYLNVAQKEGKIDGSLLSRFNTYREDIMGIPYTWGEKMVRDVTAKTLQKFGLKGKFSSDFTRAARSWIYNVSMGWRPWVPIRNSLQIWTTLAPRMGNDAVAKAARFVSGPNGGNYVDGLRAKGIIQSSLPLFGGEGIDPSTLMGRMTYKGLKAFKNSDEWTRAVAMRSAEIRFDDAMDAWRRGAIKTRDEFFDLSGMWQLPTDLKNRATELIGKGDWKSAREMFGTYLVDATMFPYRAGHSPMAFHGVLGKMFGQFGTYPTFYRENVFSALRYGNTSQRLLFASRWIGNMTAIYTAFREIGINADEFLFWQPMLFSGGPMWDHYNMFLQAMSPTYKGRQARSELLGLTTKDGKLEWHPEKSEIARFGLPYELTSIGRAIESLNRGDPWYTPILNLGSFPTFPPE